MALASMGIYAVNADFLYQELVRDAGDGSSSHDFGKDLIPYLVPRAGVFAHRFADSCVNRVGALPYWRDVGTVDSYWEANLELTRVVPELNLYDDDWPIWSNAYHYAPPSSSSTTRSIVDKPGTPWFPEAASSAGPR